MDTKHALREKPFTPRFLQGYVHGTETGDSYEEYLLLSEGPLVRGRVSSNYSWLGELPSRDTVYCVWISKTLQRRQLIVPFPRFLALITGSWVFSI